MARPEDHFIPITIDEKPYKPVPPITGAALYEMASVADNMELWIEARGKGDDIPVVKDGTHVDLNAGDKLFTARKELNPGVINER